jgi:LPS O-antigen subunit length determinant protein (WzzB/FepE family)
MTGNDKNLNKEFSLMELWNVLSKGRSIIFLTTILFLFSSIVFLFVTPRTYTVQVTVTEPSITDIQALRTGVYGIDGILEYNGESVQKTIVRNIQDYGLWRRFIAETKNKSQESAGLLNKVSHKDLRFKLSTDNDDDTKIDFFLDWENTKEPTKLIIDFLKFIDIETTKEIISNISVSINYLQRLDKNLIEETKMLIQHCDPYGQLYCSALKTNLIKSNRRIKKLKEIKTKIHNSPIKTVRVTSYDPLSYKVKPNRTLIIVLAIFFGFMFSVLLTFFLYFIKENNN